MRKIIHIDMDAFYASVEQRDNPDWRGKPVIVGGNPQSRGVVATCSYEARAFGVHSAMPTSQAYRLCPDAIFVKPRFDVYKEVSLKVRSIFYEFTDLIEPLSLDEAYLDVTESKTGNPSATLIAREIKKRVFDEVKLSCSAGVAPNKFLAKVASGYKKPAGITVITPDKAEAFIAQLPIGKFYGVGSATEKRMLELGITNGADLRERSEVELVRSFGKSGHFYYRIARGVDDREVQANRVRKSVGAENTYSEDIHALDEIHNRLNEIAQTVEQRLGRARTAGKTITLKVRYDNFEIATRSLTLPDDVSDAATLHQTACNLLPLTEAGQRKVRLLGISVSNLDLSRDGSRQLKLEL
ncbi:MAG: DNA polymerase IV [Bacteroidetes bacterium]|nr:DNA polymerase IV [Bacteroidota bacterium]MCH8523190.1 DNA polymerase IV [Balneolales bacterium]